MAKIDIGGIWFSGEKMFRIKEGGRNSQNNRLWAFSDDDPSIRVQEGDGFSKGVTASLAVSKCGIGRLIFVAEGGGISGTAYIKTLENEFTPDIRMEMAARP